MKLVSPGMGYLIIAVYFVFICLMTYLTTREKRSTKEQFLVAERKIKALPGAFSIAATWVWAPALLVSAQQAYQNGWPGLFWFTAPNVATLVFFAYLATNIREKVPKGYTISHYMEKRFRSKRIGNIFLFELIGLALCSFAVQLLAGGNIFSAITDIPFFWITVMMAAIPLTYSLFSGMKASVLTDYIQFWFILILGFTIVPWAVFRAGGISAVAAGLGGVAGNSWSLFSGAGGQVFWSFGLSSTIGLMAGPAGDQSFWQRAFSYRKEVVKKSFIGGAALFGLVPLAMGLSGFAAAGAGVPIKDPSMVNLELIVSMLPLWAVILFVYLLICGLVSTLDSNLCAISSMVAHDGLTRAGVENDRVVVRVSRISMILLTVLSVAIANIPGIKILHLFLFYGNFRASVLMPIVITLYRKRYVSERGTFWGILIALLVGCPVFAYGNFNGYVWWTVAGSLLTIGLSAGITMAFSLLEDRRRHTTPGSTLNAHR